MGTNRAFVGLKVLRDIFILIGIPILIGMLAAHMHYVSTTTSAEDSGKDLDLQTLMQRFPGYFRTCQEQAALTNRTLNSTAVITPDDCPMQAIIYHNACCQTQATSVAWTTLSAANDSDKVLNVVQIPSMKQYFEYQSCTQISPCNCNCQCTTMNITGMAVVYDPGFPIRTAYVTMVQFPGCCQCMNNP